VPRILPYVPIKDGTPGLRSPIITSISPPRVVLSIRPPRNSMVNSTKLRRVIEDKVEKGVIE